NGGSFAVTVARRANRTVRANEAVVRWMLWNEERMGLHTPAPYRDFAARVLQHREALQGLVRALVDAGRTVLGYGASTKGNVLLQYCGFTAQDIRAIAEVNEEKYGRYTPQSHIPILAEADVRSARPDYMLVLPWHFRTGIVAREQGYLAAGGKLVFPLPHLDVVAASESSRAAA
ncbi:MAG: methyltransferase C-terminal domain-containing protein, partial [Planctomycetaceae bacterium]